ncbi:hypothetical protein J8L88_23165 [Aquimarina sp. MMG015]|uniref:hypothetical protein n=1 Tax=Aquimarina sp. MMG015 TaxID=2822689 RepID=UPI001B39E388|nr:hypothetical protein [Aquimarina sp. MMG015]MBQ4805781.1 hypothetical protein [Aquimarina sp. MMG015]
MKLCCFLFTVLFIHTISAQNIDDHDAVIIDFTKGYNYLSPTTIFDLLDEKYQQTKTIDDIDQFLESHNKTLGMIEDCRVISKKNGETSYIMQAEKSVMIMKFEFSDQNKITHYESTVLQASLPTF